MLDSIRYWLAALTLVTLPPALLYWYLIHPFAASWRRLGRLPAYGFVGGVCVALGFGIWQLNEPLLRVDYGFDARLSAVAALLYAIAIYIEIRCRKHLKFHILAGAPELSAEAPGKLLDQGIYSRIRHPRYMALVFGMTAVALFLNYLAIYLVVAASVPLLYGIVLLEERELRERFGAAYVDYARRVPRFVPRRGA